jgi:HEAT repeat protein
MKRRRPRTADEVLSELEANPEWVAARAREDAELQREQAELERAEAPLVADLRAAGFAVDSAYDFIKVRTPYPKAIPILLEHLQRPYPGVVREGIARALAMPQAKYAHDLIVQLWRAEPEGYQTAKHGLAAAVAATGYPEHLDELIELVRDVRLGPTRAYLLLALEKSKEPRAWATILALGTDPEIGQAAQLSMEKRRRRKSGRRVPRTNE